AALFELDGFNPADITTYQTRFSLPNTPVTFVSIDNTINRCGLNLNQTCDSQTFQNDSSMAEVALDIEMMAALAPGVSQILSYTAVNTDQGVIDGYNQIATDN